MSDGAASGDFVLVAHPCPFSELQCREDTTYIKTIDDLAQKQYVKSPGARDEGQMLGGGRVGGSFESWSPLEHSEDPDAIFKGWVFTFLGGSQGSRTKAQNWTTWTEPGAGEAPHHPWLGNEKLAHWLGSQPYVPGFVSSPSGYRNTLKKHDLKPTVSHTAGTMSTGHLQVASFL